MKKLPRGELLPGRMMEFRYGRARTRRGSGVKWGPVWEWTGPCGGFSAQNQYMPERTFGNRVVSPRKKTACRLVSTLGQCPVDHVQDKCPREGAGAGTSFA